MIEKGLDGKTREEIGKGNQMTALRFQMGETSDIPSLPLGNKKWQHITLLLYQSFFFFFSKSSWLMITEFAYNALAPDRLTQLCNIHVREPKVSRVTSLPWPLSDTGNARTLKLSWGSGYIHEPYHRPIYDQIHEQTTSVLNLSNVRLSGTVPFEMWLLFLLESASNHFTFLICLSVYSGGSIKIVQTKHNSLCHEIKMKKKKKIGKYSEFTDYYHAVKWNSNFKKEF